MLFDLQSPRRRFVIKIVYSGLALLIGASLILTQFGSSGGGLLDSIGLGGGSTDSAFQSQIDDAQKKVDANPQDAAALLELTRAHYAAGNDKLDADPETGAAIPNSESVAEFQKTADAWDRYLKVLGNQPPDSGAAKFAADAFLSLAQTSNSAASADTNIRGAAKAQQFVAEGIPGTATYFDLATYLYFAGQVEQADAAAKKAAELAPAGQSAALTKQLAQLKTQAVKFRKQVEDEGKPQGGGATTPGAPESNPFENPLQSQPGLGSGLGG